MFNMREYTSAELETLFLEKENKIQKLFDSIHLKQRLVDSLQKDMYSINDELAEREEKESK